MDHRFDSLTPDGTDQDNAFYAELTRQILLLTEDEDDAVHVKNKCARTFNRTPAGGGGGWSLVPGEYCFSWWEGGVAPVVPGWMERLWAANGGGTGVFIPRGGTHWSRKRHKKPKKNKDGGKAHTTSGYKN
ncbi:hypothetical protein R6Q59_005454 [Mikania micrantha]